MKTCATCGKQCWGKRCKQCSISVSFEPTATEIELGTQMIRNGWNKGECMKRGDRTMHVVVPTYIETHEGVQKLFRLDNRSVS